MRPRISQLAAVGLLVLTSTLTTACESSDPPRESASDKLGCGLVSGATLRDVLGVDKLETTPGAGPASPDATTGQVTCDAFAPDKRSVFVLISVQKTSTADLRTRDNWRSAKPTMNRGCSEPSYIKHDDLGGVSCIELQSTGQAVSMFTISPTHYVTVQLARGSDVSATDVDGALKISEAVHTNAK